MLSSVNRLFPGLAVAAGIGAFVLPLIAPWHLLTVAGAAIAVTFAATGRMRIMLSTAALGSLVLVLVGYLPSPMAAATLSAAALGMTGRVGMAVAVLLLDLSATATAQELVGDLLHRAGLEAAAPGVVAGVALGLVSISRRHAITAMVGGLMAIGAIWLGNRIATAPEAVLALGALPIIVVAVILNTSGPQPCRSVIPVCTAMAVALASWAWALPKTGGEVWLLMPEAPEAHEARFFTDLVRALHFAGVPAKKASSPEEIPPRVTVLMPWLSAPFADDRRVGDLARERHWTVVGGGEHTDMGEIVTRIEAMAGRALLRRDLTTPPGNSDDSGPLRMPGLYAWPHEAVLNRGASVTVTSLADRVLLAGDGWWAEPDVGEWLWVGDYVWHPGDRAGRLALAAVSDIGGARWLVLGDNSPMVNRQLIADPRGAIHLLRAASLWPAFLHDFLLGMLAVAIALGFSPIVIIVLPMITSLMAVIADRPSQAWKDVYLGESGFDERNFNNVLADNPALIAGRRLIRMKAPVAGSLKLPDGPATMFLLIDGSADIGGVRLNRCHRLGALVTSEGPYLMDGQACWVEGNARVLIGTEAAAAAIAVSNGGAEVIIVLDTAFLGHKAPEANVGWLLKEIGR